MVSIVSSRPTRTVLSLFYCFVARLQTLSACLSGSGTRTCLYVDQRFEERAFDELGSIVVEEYALNVKVGKVGQ